MVVLHLGAWVMRAGGGSERLYQARVHSGFIQYNHQEMGL